MHIPVLAELDIKGIMVTPQGRMALIVGPEGTYIAKAGKLINRKKEVVPTIATVVEEESVRLISADESITLQLRSESEEETKL